MLKVEGLKLPPDAPPDALRRRAERVLGEEVLSLRVLRRALDARKEPVFVYTAAVEVRDEGAALRRGRDRRVSRMEPETPYRLPEPGPPPETRPVVVGAGPAGLFAALVLASAGARPVLVEQGWPVERRRADVERFRAGGAPDPYSNVQFGEGGAGAFSDGKLNTGTRDPRHRFILQRFVQYGAPPDILIDTRPHVGTDRLFTVLQAFRRDLLDLGADIRFGCRMTDLRTDGGRLVSIRTETREGTEELPCTRLLLCPGHSARDTFALLARRGVPMAAKPFAVGVRVEHRQADVDRAQYGRYAGTHGLPAASYKLSCHTRQGRGVFSFCVCPGGEVVAAASEAGGVVTNGMSGFARDGSRVNGGLLVGVTPEDFGGAGPLAGIAFQRRLEAAAFALGGGDYRAPAQCAGDFLAGRPSTGPGGVVPTYRPGVTWTDLRECLPDFVTDALREALPLLGGKLRGFDAPDAVLTAVESRSSSPVRILRDASGQSALRGLYPCGEGAGYAGGILSAAADGMRSAESLLTDLRGESDFSDS